MRRLVDPLAAEIGDDRDEQVMRLLLDSLASHTHRPATPATTLATTVATTRKATR